MFLSIQLLHIPDGFLSLSVSIVCWLISLTLLYFAVRNTRETFDESLAPLAGIMAAFIFAAQMLNFPVAGGTSGHMLGGVLAAIMLGPWVGILVMTAVVGLQALLFQDGGLVVMGANILNMGLLTVLIGYGLYSSVSNKSKGVMLGITAVAAWLSVMAGALATGLELWLSGTSDLRVVIPAMLSVHAVIGIGEALITVAAVAFILQVRPDLLSGRARSDNKSKGWIVVGFILALAVVFLAPFAVSDPDGLERVAQDVGFIDNGVSAPYELLPDYTISFLGETSASTIAAGLVGAILVAGIVIFAVKVLRKNEPQPLVSDHQPQV